MPDRPELQRDEDGRAPDVDARSFASLAAPLGHAEKMLARHHGPSKWPK